MKWLPDRARLWQLTLAAYWITLFVATHLPRELSELPKQRADKLVHVAAFAVLAWLLAMAWEKSAGRLNAAHLRAAWMLLAVYAAIEELTQIPVGRTCSFADWLADVAGAALGLIMFRWLRPRE
jgi:VanZ family protein